MKRNFKKVLSLILVLAIVMAMVPESRAENKKHKIFKLDDYSVTIFNESLSPKLIKDYGLYEFDDGSLLMKKKYMTSSRDGQTNSFKTLEKFPVLQSRIDIKYAIYESEHNWKIGMGFLSDKNNHFVLGPNIHPSGTVCYISFVPSKDGNNKVDVYECTGNYYGLPGSKQFDGNKGAILDESAKNGAHIYFDSYIVEMSQYDNEVDTQLKVFEIEVGNPLPSEESGSSKKSDKKKEKKKKKSSGSRGVIVTRYNTLEEMQAADRERREKEKEKEKEKEREENAKLMGPWLENFKLELGRYVAGEREHNLEAYILETGDTELTGLKTYYETNMPYDMFGIDWSFIDDYLSSGSSPELVATNPANPTNIDKEPELENGDAVLSSLETASDWAKGELRSAIEAGFYTSAMMESDYKSYATREEFSELVMQLFYKLGGEVKPSDNPFTDTNNPEVIKAYNAGIISGVGADKFDPYSNLTREQFCVLIVRTLNVTNKDYDKDASFQKIYADMSQISPWAMDSLKVMNGYKIINGDGMNLGPKDQLTKEMAIIMLYRAYEKFK